MSKPEKPAFVHLGDILNDKQIAAVQAIVNEASSQRERIDKLKDYLISQGKSVKHRDFVPEYLAYAIEANLSPHLGLAFRIANVMAKFENKFTNADMVALLSMRGCVKPDPETLSRLDLLCNMVAFWMGDTVEVLEILDTIREAELQKAQQQERHE